MTDNSIQVELTFYNGIKLMDRYHGDPNTLERFYIGREYDVSETDQPKISHIVSVERKAA